MTIATTPTWAPPSRDPAFARWLEDLLANPYRGPRPDPYDYVTELSDATGFSEAELCSVLGYPADYFEGEGDDEGDED